MQAQEAESLPVIAPPSKGKNLGGRPRKPLDLETLAPPLAYPAYRDLDLAETSQTPEKQAADLRNGAYYIAKRCELKLHRALDIGAKNLWEDIRAWGTAADKVLASVQGEGQSITIPVQLIEKMAVVLRNPSVTVQTPIKQINDLPES